MYLPFEGDFFDQIPVTWGIGGSQVFVACFFQFFPDEILHFTPNRSITRALQSVTDTRMFMNI